MTANSNQVGHNIASDNKNSNELQWDLTLTVTISSDMIQQMTDTAAVRSHYGRVSKCHKAINSDRAQQVTATVSTSSDNV